MIEQDTIRLLRECAAGVKMGISSIEEVIDRVQADAFRRELASCRSGHQKIEKEIRGRLNGFEDSGKEPNPIAKGIAAYKLETVEDVRRMMAFSLHGMIADRIESYDDDTYEGLQVRGDHERRVKGVEYTDMFAPAFELLKKWEDS